MDYAEQVKTLRSAYGFTFTEYSRLKRRPPKVKTKPETKPDTVLAFDFL